MKQNHFSPYTGSLEGDLDLVTQMVEAIEKGYWGNHGVIDPDYLTPTMSGVGNTNTLPLDHKAGAYHYYKKIQLGLQSGIELGFIPEGLIPRAPDYVDKLIE